MENLPIKNENSIFNKIKRFLHKLFSGPVENEIQDEVLADSVVLNEKIDTGKLKEEFDNDLKVEVSGKIIKEKETEKKRDEFIRQIEENPDLLNSFSLERLEKLDKIYDKLISEEEKKLNALKNS